MNCNEFQDQLFEALDGALPAEARRELDRHLAACEACRAALQEQRQLGRELAEGFQRSTQALTLDPEVRRRVLATLATKAAPGAGRRPRPFSASEEESVGVRGLFARWVESLAALWHAPLRRWAVAGCGLAATAVAAGLWLSPRSPAPSHTRVAEAGVTISARVPVVLTTYTFQKHGRFVTDTLVHRTEIVRETFVLSPGPGSHSKTPVNEMSL